MPNDKELLKTSLDMIFIDAHIDCPLLSKASKDTKRNDLSFEFQIERIRF